VVFRLRCHYACAAAQDDALSWVTLDLEEFAHPIRFYFLRWQDEQGATGFEFIRDEVNPGPVSLASVAGVDLDGYGLTDEQQSWLRKARPAYRTMAKCAIETPWDLETARRAYRALALLWLGRRKQGTPWTDAELRLVVDYVEPMRREGFRLDEIATALGWSRSKLMRARRQARERAL
jgi:hypothetical protein